MSSNKSKHTARKLTASVIVIIILMLCLCVTTYALVMVSVSVNDNYFQTGTVDINLNDGKSIIEEHEFIFEPGMTVTKDFFIKNEGTGDVYYKIYLDEVNGGLATVLQITISHEDQVLFDGTAIELSRENVNAVEDTLKVGQKLDLTISFHYPEDAGNITQDNSLAFKVCADAVQVKNNPDKLFD